VSELPIDLVIPFVDGSAPGYADALRGAGGRFVPCQHRSNGELRYALRSWRRHAPWLRTVFLAVFDPAHCPTWVDRNAVRVVSHESFIPADLRPAMQYAPIVMSAHRIPDLSESFILSEDDLFLGGPAAPSDFFDAAGAPRLDLYESPIVTGRWGGAYGAALMNTARVLRARPTTPIPWLFPHAPLPGRRSDWRRLASAFGDDPDVRATLEGRVRVGEEDPRREIALNQLFASHVDAQASPRSTARRALRCALLQTRRLAARVGVGRAPWGFYALRHDPARTRRDMRRLLRERPRVFCVNDEGYDLYEDETGAWHTGPELNPASRRSMIETLTRLFPDPCDLELPSR
jgi:hypothetical protein